MVVLKQLRKQNNKTQAQIAKFLGITQQAYATYELDTRTPPLDIVKALADYFNVSVDYLLGRAERFIPSNAVSLGGLIKMPVIGSISAGYDGTANEEILDEYEVPKKALKGYPVEDCFVLQVKGDSMYPQFLNKDIIVVHRQSSVDSGETAVILYNGDEATLKKVVYKKGEDWLELIPRNPEYQTMRIEGSDLEQCRVLGKVISLVYRDVQM